MASSMLVVEDSEHSRDQRQQHMTGAQDVPTMKVTQDSGTPGQRRSVAWSTPEVVSFEVEDSEKSSSSARRSVLSFEVEGADAPNPVMSFLGVPSARMSFLGSASEAATSFTVVKSVVAILEAPAPKAGFWGTVMNMAKTMLGAAFLAIPDAFKFGSLLPSVIVFCAAWVVSCKCLQIVMELCVKHNVPSFRGLLIKLVGPISAFICDICIVLNSVFSCTSYTMMTSEWITVGISQLFGNPFDTHDTFALVINLVISTFVFLPLCLQRDLSAITKLSVVGMACTGLGMLFVVWQAFMHWNEPLKGRACGEANDCTSTSVLEAALFQPSWHLLVTFNLELGMIMPHYNAPKFVAEYHTNDIGELKRLAAVATLLSVFCAITTAVFGVLRLGTGFKDGNILVRFNEQFPILSQVEQKTTLLVWLLMAFNLVACFPLLFQPGRISLLQLVGSSVQSLTACGYLIFTIALVAFNVWLGIVVPNFTLMMKFKGSLCGFPIAVIFPGLLFWAESRMQSASEGKTGLSVQSAMAACLVLLGYFMMIYSFVAAIMAEVGL